MTEQPPPSTAFKPLLLEALGEPFLAYVLGLSEAEIRVWATSDSDLLDTHHQDEALKCLFLLLQMHGGDDIPTCRHSNLAWIFGRYDAQYHATVVHLLRVIALGQDPALLKPAPSIDNVVDMLATITRDFYPIYLLPEVNPYGHNAPVGIYQHPLREPFEAALMQEGAFASYFVKQNENPGSYGLARSTGKASVVGLEGFAGLLLGGGWRAAKISSFGTPTLDEHIKAVCEQLEIVRAALTQKSVQVPVRVAFTGVTVDNEELFDLGWGILRKPDARDRVLVSRSVGGKHSGTGPDGQEVTIDYSGDVVLETAMEYRIHRRMVQLDDWPGALKGYEQVQRLIEGVQLGALLSQEFRGNEPVTVVPAWQFIHDPLDDFYDVGRYDPQRNRSFMPRCLSAEEFRRWGMTTMTVVRNRTPHIDVAVRRTLRAAAERRDYADVLVDAIIAWENLFGVRGATTMSITSALAWLLGENHVERRRLRREFAELYGVRSDIVHGDESHSPRELVEIGQRALKVAIEALRVLFQSRPELLSECSSGDDRSLRLMMGG